MLPRMVGGAVVSFISRMLQELARKLRVVPDFVMKRGYRLCDEARGADLDFEIERVFLVVKRGLLI